MTRDQLNQQLRTSIDAFGDRGPPSNASMTRVHDRLVRTTDSEWNASILESQRDRVEAAAWIP